MSKGVTATATAKTRQDDFSPYKVENVINFADALVLKGSALAADDIITALVVPPGTAILGAGLQTMTVDDATTLTLHLGITTTVGTAAADIDEWVLSYDQAAATAGAYAPALDAVPGIVVCDGFTPIDMELATLTGTLTVGKVRVWAILCPIGAANKDVGIALVGS
jgi:hypothetical protein